MQVCEREGEGECVWAADCVFGGVVFVGEGSISVGVGGVMAFPLKPESSLRSDALSLSSLPPTSLPPTSLPARSLPVRSLPPSWLWTPSSSSTPLVGPGNDEDGDDILFVGAASKPGGFWNS